MPRANNPDEEFVPHSDFCGGFVRLYCGHVSDVLARLPAGSVHCVVTSPPYWGLRDYGTGTWEGGESTCDHLRSHKNTKGVCRKCGARRIDQQIGSEPSFDCQSKGQAQCGRCYVCATVAWAREVRRVLRDDGVFWLNLGDSYASGERGRHDAMDGRVYKALGKAQETRQKSSTDTGIPSGNLVGIPWRIALALQADGWILRSDIPWVKRSPIPESVKNRPAKALEYVFLFVKRMGYHYDDKAVRRTGNSQPSIRDKNAEEYYADYPGGVRFSSGNRQYGAVGCRNFWNADLWFDSVDSPHGLTGVNDELVGLDVTTAGYVGAHFATYPPKLIEPLILAGTSERGCCPSCGKCWERVMDNEVRSVRRPESGTQADAARRREVQIGGNNVGTNSLRDGFCETLSVTLDWRPGCDCSGLEIIDDPPKKPIQRRDETSAAFSGRLRHWTHLRAKWRTKWERLAAEYEKLEVVPCVVLDPFVGSGTTCCVAAVHGRRSIGIDLSAEYLDKQASQRVAEWLIACGRLSVVNLPRSSGRVVVLE